MHRRRLRRTPMLLFRCVCQRKPIVAKTRHGAAYGRRAARRAHSVPGPQCPFDRDHLRGRSRDPASRHRRLLQVSGGQVNSSQGRRWGGERGIRTLSLKTSIVFQRATTFQERRKNSFTYQLQ